MKLNGPLAAALIPRLAAGLIRALRVTMRIRCAGGDNLRALRKAGGSYIHAFWHGHLLLMPYSYTGGRIAVMISEHRDGEYIARTMERFGYSSVRGSTTSGGAAALRKAVRLARQGWDLGFTPDGPRGPRHVAQMGVITAARLSGLPIVPVGFAADPAREIGSWDRFVVPYPFSRGVFVYGEPVVVERGSDGEAMEELRLRVEEAIVACTEQAREHLSDRGGFVSLEPLRSLP